MLSNAYFLAKICFDTAENEPAKNLLIIPILLTLTPKLGQTATAAAPGDRARELWVGDGRRHDGRSAKFRQNVARFRLYRHRFLQENMRFAAFFEIYQIMQLKIFEILQNFADFAR